MRLFFVRKKILGQKKPHGEHVVVPCGLALCFAFFVSLI